MEERSWMTFSTDCSALGIREAGEKQVPPPERADRWPSAELFPGSGPWAFGHASTPAAPCYPIPILATTSASTRPPTRRGKDIPNSLAMRKESPEQKLSFPRESGFDRCPQGKYFGSVRVRFFAGSTSVAGSAKSARVRLSSACRKLAGTCSLLQCRRHHAQSRHQFQVRGRSEVQPHIQPRNGADRGANPDHRSGPPLHVAVAPAGRVYDRYPELILLRSPSPRESTARFRDPRHPGRLPPMARLPLLTSAALSRRMASWEPFSRGSGF